MKHTHKPFHSQNYVFTKWTGAIVSFLLIHSISCTAPKDPPPVTDVKLPVYKYIPVKYPATRKDHTIVDDYHGTLVKDPYRWLENVGEHETIAWIDSQNTLTQEYFSQLPHKEDLVLKLKALLSHERRSSPFLRGGAYYAFENNGLQNQSILYRLSSKLKREKLILDPNLLSENGTASLGKYAFNEPGSLLAYEISAAGSDWKTIKVLDLVKGKSLADELKGIKFSNIAWREDGFFYSRYDLPKSAGSSTEKHEFQQVYYHRIGTDQIEDELIFADRQHPQRGFTAYTSSDERYLIISFWESSNGNGIFWKDLEMPRGKFLPLVKETANKFQFIYGDAEYMYFLTDHMAPNYRLLRINPEKPDRQYWEEVIPEKEAVLQSVHRSGNYFLAHYIQLVQSRLSVYSLDGKLQRKVKLDGIGSIRDIKASKKKDMVYFKFDSFLGPAAIHSLNVASLDVRQIWKPKVAFNSSDYITKQIAYTSKDGTKIPMYINYKKGIASRWVSSYLTLWVWWI